MSAIRQCGTGDLAEVEVHMKNILRINQELLEEITSLKRRLRELQRSEAEHERMEDEFRLTRQELQLLIDAGPDFFFLKDLDLRYQFVNSGFARFLGREKAGILGRTDRELTAEGPALACEAGDRKAVRERRPVVVVEPFEGRFYETIRFPVNVGGEVVGVAGIVRDITEHKQDRDALVEAIETCRSIFENAVMGIFQTTPDGRFIFVNRSLARTYGYDSAQEMIDTVTNIGTEIYVNPEDRVRFLELLEREGVAQKLELPCYQKDKSIVWVAVNARAVRDAEGNTARFEGTIEDITDRKNFETALKESEEKYRSVVESSFIGSFIVQDRFYRFVNSGFCQITGYRYDELVDRLHPLDLVHPDDKKKVQSNLEKRMSREVDHVEYVVKAMRKDGRTIHIKVFGTSLMYNGKPAAGGTIVDVTREKNLELQLLQKQKLQAIGTLAGGIAHDFNNILNGIIGFAEMVHDDIAPDSPEYQRLGLVLKGARRGRDLVEQILTFSRHTEPKNESVALSGIVEESLRLLRPLFPSTVEIRFRGMDREDTILADSGQIHQVLMNLCTNGVQAMGRKGGVLEIGVTVDHFKKGDPVPTPDMKPGRYVTLMVRDTGSGMKPDVLERVFDPFFTTRARGEGTGLGLSVVHGIVKSHRGFIKVESEPGLGSAFTVYLPRMEKPNHMTSGEEVPLRGGNEHILFVDDEDIIVELNNQRLAQLGYEIVATTSSLEALRIFKREPERFHLVITDYTMPGMNGLDLAKEFLKIRKDIPIILCTGYTEDVSPDKARKAGIKEFLMKPLSKTEVSTAIRRALDG